MRQPQDREERESAIRAAAPALAERHGIDDHSALNLASYDYDIAALHADDGEHPSGVWFLSAGPRPEPARSWEPGDYEADVRRANAHGLPLDRPYWQAAVDNGQDPVNEAFEARKQSELARLRGLRNSTLTNALLTAQRETAKG